MSDHDFFCESDDVYPGISSPCACSYRSSRGLVEQFEREVAEKTLVAARVKPAWQEYLPSDGEFEYTRSTECDGSVLSHLRRRPRYEGMYHPWEETTAEAFDAAVLATSPDALPTEEAP